ncbi:MAG TPA: HEAT repeat domain-containing protein [Planctomycetota bacterium]|nr:HEAT repeat domain-containing protein [Planctomycetota bacterium]
MKHPSSSSNRGAAAPGGQASGRWSSERRLQAAVFLGLALVFLGAFAVLVVLKSRSGRGELSRPVRSSVGDDSAGDGSATLVSPSEIPYGDPSAPDPTKSEKLERFGGKFPRWNLRELPEGWDEATAIRIHSLFEAMEFDPMDGEKLKNLGALRDELQDYLAQLGPEALPTLAAILNAEGDFVDRRFIIYGIGNLGPKTEGATYVLRDFFMARCARPESRTEMIHVAKAMSDLQNDSSFWTLSELIRHETETVPAIEGFRSNFIEALGEHPRREEALNLFVSEIHEDPVLHARNKAAQALGKIRSPETLPELYAAVEKEPHYFIRQTLLGSIGKVGKPESIPFLEKHARHASDYRIRLSAAGAIRRIATPYGQAVLREIAQSDPEPEVRSRAAKWAGES